MREKILDIAFKYIVWYIITLRGMQPVAWFLWTLILIDILAPCILEFRRKHNFYYNIIVFIMLILLAAERSMSLKYNWTIGIEQKWWLHVYLPYWMLGTVLAQYQEKIYSLRERFGMKFHILEVIVLVVSYAVFMQNAIIKNTGLNPDRFYGTFFYTFWIVNICLFVFSIFQDRQNNRIHYIARNTFSVYMIHLPILLKITAIHKVKSFSEVVFIVILLFLIGNIVAVLFRKLPVLRKAV